MQADAILPGQTVVIVDDIIATGALCLPSVIIYQDTNNELVLILVEYSPLCRWIGCGCRRTRNEARWQSDGISFCGRGDLPWGRS